MIAFRDKRVTPTTARPDGIRLIIASVQESIDTGHRRRVHRSVGFAEQAADPPCSTPSKVRFRRGFSAVLAATRTGPRQGRVFSSVTEFGRWDPRTASRAVVDLQRPNPAGRIGAGVPAVELDRARHLALHRTGEHRSAADLLRLAAMSSNATGFC